MERSRFGHEELKTAGGLTEQGPQRGAWKDKGLAESAPHAQQPSLDTGAGLPGGRAWLWASCYLPGTDLVGGHSLTPV